MSVFQNCDSGSDHLEKCRSGSDLSGPYAFETVNNVSLRGIYGSGSRNHTKCGSDKIRIRTTGYDSTVILICLNLITADVHQVEGTFFCECFLEQILQRYNNCFQH